MKELIALGDDTKVTREVPSDFLLLKKGHNKFTVNGKVSEFDLDDSSIDTILHEFNGRDKDLVIDYDHSTLNQKASTEGNAPAGGWARLEKVANGIKANVNNWTDKARQRLLDGEYRYFSPVLRFDKSTQKPISIHSLGLTNHPAIHSSASLVACSDLFIDDTVAMNDVEAVVSDYKDVVVKAKRAIDNMKTQLDDGLQALSELGADNEEMSKDIQAFADDLFSGDYKNADNEIVALADIANEFDMLRSNTQSVDELKMWIDKKIEEINSMIETVQDIAQKDALQKDIEFLLEQKNLLNTEIAKEDSVVTQVEDMKSIIESNDPAIQLSDGIDDVKIVKVVVPSPEVLKDAPMPPPRDESGELIEDDEEIFSKMQEFITSLQESIEDIAEIKEKLIAEYQGKFRKGFPMKNLADTMVCPRRKMIENQEIIQQMSDLDLNNTYTDSDIISNIKSLNDFKVETNQMFTDLDVTSNEEVIKKFSDLEDKIETEKATAIVDQIINSDNCKISASMRKWAIDYAKRDYKAFNDFVADSPVFFSELPKIGKNVGKPQKQFSEAQRKMSELFGNKVEDIF